jgi:hypothetical protein
MGRWVAVLVLMALTSWVRASNACSCMRPVLSRTLSPADGARDVPTDAVVRVFLEAFAPELRQAVAKEMRLREASGAVVATSSTIVATRIDYRPDGPLKPNTRYVIEQLVAYDDKGGRLTDTERWQHALGYSPSTAPKKIVLAWFETASFTTDVAGAGATTLPTPVVQKASLHRAHGGGDCGPANSLWMKLDPLTLPASSSLELEVRGQGVVTTMPPGSHDSIRAGNSLCAYDKVWLKLTQAPLTARVVVRGASTATAAGAWQTVLGPTGHVRPRRPIAPDVLTRWNGARRIKPPRAPADKPLHCAFGLESVASKVATQTGGAWTYDALGSVGEVGSKLATVATAPNNKHPLLIIGKGTRVGLKQTGRNPRAWFDGAGALVGTTEWRSSGDAGVVVARVDRRGKARWTKSLGAAGEVHQNPRVVAGDGGALVAWIGPGKPSYADELCWATFNDSNGRALASSKSCIPTVEGYPAVAAVGKRFMVAHHRRSAGSMGSRGDAELLIVGPGAPKKHISLTIGTRHGGMDMAVVADREVGVVGAKDGQIVWAKLAADGRLLRGPKVISRGGDNRKPRITWGHGTFAVVWERFPGQHSYAVTVDRFGTTSGMQELFAGMKSGTVAVTATKDGFATSATLRRNELVTERLRCRKQATQRAPDQIQLP